MRTQWETRLRAGRLCGGCSCAQRGG
uniref:Uncharacterized protein n=1 Tax=Arundo donax TaxID=35708 RepID=A0A0A9AZP6_ARUDO